MTIGYIFSYFGDGGAEENAYLLAQSAKDAGYKPLFIISSFSILAMKRLESHGFEVVNLPMESSFGIGDVLQSAKDLKKIIRDKNINIIHAHMLREQSLAIISKMLGSKFKLARTFHRFDQFNKKMKPLMPIYRKFTDAFIAICPEMKHYLAKNGISGKVHMINNGVAQVKALDHVKALGFIGRLTPEKGILEFISANLDILKQNDMVIAGDGPDYKKIQELAKTNNLKITLLGNITDKADYYKRISVLVLPSETEVLPLVILEAYSCGLPVVAFNLLSLKGLVGKENGELVDYPNYSQLGATAVKIMAKSGSYSKANIARYTSEYSVSKMWNDTGKLYENLIGLHK